MLDVSAATPERRCSRTREAVGARRNSWPPLVAALNFFFFFFFSGSLFSLDSLFLSLLKLERASLASSSLSLYNHAEPRSPEATAAAADGRLASQRYGISIADEAFFGGSLSLSLVTLSQPSLDSHLFLPHSTTRTNSLWRGPRRGRLGSPGACLRRAR